MSSDYGSIAGRLHFGRMRYKDPGTLSSLLLNSAAHELDEGDLSEDEVDDILTQHDDMKMCDIDSDGNDDYVMTVNLFGDDLAANSLNSEEDSQEVNSDEIETNLDGKLRMNTAIDGYLKEYLFSKGNKLKVIIVTCDV